VPPLGQPEDGSAAVEGETETLLEKSGIDEFSICLQRDSKPSQKDTWPPGWLKFNAPPSANADKKVQVVGKIHWGVKMSAFGIPGKTPNLCANAPGCGAIVDSGTSLIAAPRVILEQFAPIFQKINLDCSGMEDLPDIQFTLGEDTFSLPPNAYVMKVTTAEMDPSLWDWLMGTPKVQVKDECVPAFMPMDKVSQFGPIFILGMPFLRYYKTTFVRSSPPQMYFDKVNSYCDVIPDSDMYDKKWEDYEKEAKEKEASAADAQSEANDEAVEAGAPATNKILREDQPMQIVPMSAAPEEEPTARITSATAPHTKKSVKALRKRKASIDDVDALHAAESHVAEDKQHPKKFVLKKMEKTPFHDTGIKSSLSQEKNVVEKKSVHRVATKGRYAPQVIDVNKILIPDWVKDMVDGSKKKGETFHF